MNQDQEMEVIDLAELKGIPVQTIHYWIKNGLPATYRRNRAYIRLDDFEKWMEERVEIGTMYKLKPPPNDKES